MAMLFLDEVAQRTWPGRLQPVREQPYWSEVTSRVRHAHPDFLFLAEASWDLECALFEEGTDFCYDKRLYDGLRLAMQRACARTSSPIPAGRRGSSASRDPLARAFWSRALATIASEHLRDGDWRLLEVTGWPDNQRCRNLLAWRWARHLVVINYGRGPADGLVKLGPELAGQTWELHDLVRAESYRRDGDDLAGRGLYVALPPYEVHVFRLAPLTTLLEA